MTEPAAGMTLTELAEQISVSKSSAFALLQTLVARAACRIRTERQGHAGYQPGGRAMTLVLGVDLAVSAP